jgi:hypothetical protein
MKLSAIETDGWIAHILEDIVLDQGNRTHPHVDRGGLDVLVVVLVDMDVAVANTRRTGADVLEYVVVVGDVAAALVAV